MNDQTNVGQVKPRKSVTPPKRPAGSRPPLPAATEPQFLITAQKFLVQKCEQTSVIQTRWTNCNRPEFFKDALEYMVYTVNLRATQLKDNGFVNLSDLITEDLRPEIVEYQHNKLVRIHIWYKDKKTGSSRLEAYRMIPTDER